MATAIRGLRLALGHRDALLQHLGGSCRCAIAT